MSEEPTVNEYGDEIHPAYGRAQVVRMSSTGTALFDSDIKHHNVMTLRIHHASRKRDLNHDWIHDVGPTVVEVQMSEAQWASLVSSINTQGVPVAITTIDGKRVPDVPYEPRLAESTAEVRQAAEQAFDKVREALAAYEEKKSTANLRTLHYAIHNAPSNLTFAAESLNKHAENVMQRARADIEAMVTMKAQSLGLTADDLGPLALEAKP